MGMMLVIMYSMRLVELLNPVDHPMGGGEGRASGGHPRSRTGLYAKGLKTRAPKKQSSKYIIERRK
jgi:large subunit ribosomal protein L2